MSVLNMTFHFFKQQVLVLQYCFHLCMYCKNYLHPCIAKSIRQSQVDRKVGLKSLCQKMLTGCQTMMRSVDITGAMKNLSLRSFSSLQRDEREVVSFLSLNNLKDNEGAVKTRRRVGRGIGSSKGKTCGRGHKGQKARSGGGVKPFFEGGQTSFIKRIPKRGFKNNNAEPMVPVNVGTIQDYIDMGRLVPSEEPITIKDLVEAGVTKCSSVKHGVKLLAKGKERLKTPIKIEISRASEGAIEAIEKAGGEITTVHYNRLALRALLKPEKFDIVPKRARPPPKLMQYYTDYDKRGFLSPEVQLKKIEERLEKDQQG